MQPIRVPSGYLTDGVQLFWIEQFTPEYVVLTDCYTDMAKAVPLDEFVAMELRAVQPSRDRVAV